MVDHRKKIDIRVNIHREKRENFLIKKKLKNTGGFEYLSINSMQGGVKKLKVEIYLRYLYQHM